jgi:dTDP-4-dehydrorhamnose 3,5-epimerase
MGLIVQKITTRRFNDSRGWFSEVYSEPKLADAGIQTRFVQDNHSFSRHSGTIRGVHFQAPPHAQAKLVRCTRGRIIDYAVDLRKGSPTFAKFVSAELTPDNGAQLFIPIGFGHAFVTLEPDTEVMYKVSDVYAPECDGGVLWNDPLIGISWPLPESGPVLSEKDMGLPSLTDFESPFEYTGSPLEHSSEL